MSTPSRYSQWAISLPFSLNNDYYNIPAQTRLFHSPTTKAIPVLAEFNPIGSDPSGWRHLTVHPTFAKLLASGEGYASIDFGSLDLNATDISTGSGVSQTRVFLFRINSITSPGVSKVYDIRMWLSDSSDFLVPGSHKVLFKTSTPWLSGFKFFPTDIGNTSYWLSDSLPESQNVFRTDGYPIIYGSGDQDVSQWIYVALGASGTLPLGEYGRNIGNQPSGFIVRISYNIDNLPSGY